jgi:hypothetical protein
MLQRIFALHCARQAAQIDLTGGDGEANGPDTEGRPAPGRRWLPRYGNSSVAERTLPPTSSQSSAHRRPFLQVERSATRCFADDAYAEAGCELVTEGSWATAPIDALILGLRGPGARTRDLVHHHCYFGHCYKQQPGWERVCTRFLRGGGVLLDLEYARWLVKELPLIA